MDKLNPCPFCGDEDIRLARSERVVRSITSRVISISTRYKYFCAGCSCETGFRVTEEAARAAWDRRADNGE